MAPELAVSVTLAGPLTIPGMLMLEPVRLTVVPVTLPGILSAPVSVTVTLEPPFTVPVTARFGMSASANPVVAVKLPSVITWFEPVSRALVAALPVSNAVLTPPVSVIPAVFAVSVKLVVPLTVPAMPMSEAVSAIRSALSAVLIARVEFAPVEVQREGTRRRDVAAQCDRGARRRQVCQRAGCADRAAEGHRAGPGAHRQALDPRSRRVHRA